MEDTFRGILDAGDVHRDQILGHLLPLDGPGSARVNMEHLGPQPKKLSSLHRVLRQRNLRTSTISFRGIPQRNEGEEEEEAKWGKEK